MHYAEFAEDEVSTLAIFFCFSDWEQYSKWLGLVNSFTGCD